MITTRLNKRTFRQSALVALLLAYFALVASAVISRNVFERLPHLEDEMAYLYQAKIFAAGRFYVERGDDPAQYFWQPFVLQPDDPHDGINKRFGKYTPGWSLALALGVLVDQWWVVNAFCGMLTVALTYRLAREVFKDHHGEEVGLVSALLLAISPMALLLNATLMAHPFAMLMTVTFVYCYWRTTKNGTRWYGWAIVGGLAAGMLIATRPWTAIAMGAPIALHALARFLDSFSTPRYMDQLFLVFRSLFVMALAVMLTASTWLLANTVWTGSPTTNTYTLLWAYDKVGFGEGYGLNKGGHSLYYGFRNAREDIKTWNRDLFGFTLDAGIAEYLSKNLGWGWGVGLSWIPFVYGFIVGRKRDWIWVFTEIVLAIMIFQLAYWIGSWVQGAAAYSLRYYYESTFAACIVSAYGIVTWAHRLRGDRRVYAVDSSIHGGSKNVSNSPEFAINYLNGAHDSTHIPSVALSRKRFLDRVQLAWHNLSPGYLLLLIACGVSLVGYTPARFREPAGERWPNGLYRYNKIGQHQLQAIDDMRAQLGAPDQPVLILILRNPDPGVRDNWRDYGAALAMTSPTLDSEIVVMRIFEKSKIPESVQRFPGRLVLYQVGETLYASAEEALGEDSEQDSDSG
jgi:hypothetical protein